MPETETNPNDANASERKGNQPPPHAAVVVESAFEVRTSPACSELISDQERLGKLLPVIAKNQRVAADTEADSLHCYREKLCLLQISIPEGDFLVDPLAENDLVPLARLLANRELVLHGADYDLRLLRRGLNFQPGRLFDTMIAARLLGVREFSYAAMVEKYFGVQLTKGSQKANWALRPLSPKMEEYARNDTHYLLPLAERLERELLERNRLDWLRQSCARLIDISATDRERDGEEAWRVRGAGLMHGLEAAILRALWHWRDAEAQRADRPAFHILRNDQLIQAAQTAATGGHPKFRHLSTRRARGFEDAIEEARALAEESWPQLHKRRGPRPTPEMLRASDALRKQRDAAATKLGMEPSFIAPRAAIDLIAADRSRAESLLVPWQRELLGLE